MSSCGALSFAASPNTSGGLRSHDDDFADASIVASALVAPSNSLAAEMTAGGILVGGVAGVARENPSEPSGFAGDFVTRAEVSVSIDERRERFGDELTCRKREIQAANYGTARAAATPHAPSPTSDTASPWRRRRLTHRD